MGKKKKENTEQRKNVHFHYVCWDSIRSLVEANAAFSRVVASREGAAKGPFSGGPVWKWVPGKKKKKDLAKKKKEDPDPNVRKKPTSCHCLRKGKESGALVAAWEKEEGTTLRRCASLSAPKITAYHTGEKKEKKMFLKKKVRLIPR